MASERIKALLIEDTEVDATLIKALLAQSGEVKFDVARVSTMGEAATLLSRFRVDVILLDLNLPDSRELASFRKVSDLAAGCPIVILTSLEDEGIAIQAVKEGAQDYLYKTSMTSDVMVRAVRYAIERQKIKLELSETVRSLQKALGEVKALRGLLPICSSCKKVRDDQGYWSQVEVYLSERSGLDFTHSMCPGCHREHYPEVFYKTGGGASGEIAKSGYGAHDDGHEDR